MKKREYRGKGGSPGGEGAISGEYVNEKKHDTNANQTKQKTVRIKNGEMDAKAAQEPKPHTVSMSGCIRSLSLIVSSTDGYV